jgi:hypothetical protein
MVMVTDGEESVAMYHLPNRTSRIGQIAHIRRKDGLEIRGPIASISEQWLTITGHPAVVWLDDVEEIKLER